MRYPKVSVIMSVFNTPLLFLKKSIESILSQTYRDFEFIIVDDASSDWVIRDVLVDYKRQDDRILLIMNEKNLGLTRSLNKALQIARGKYIARQDSDDISLSERLEMQIEFLEKKENIALLGTKGFIIDEKDQILGYWDPVTEPVQLKKKIFRGNQFLHTSVVFRKEVVIGLGSYDEHFRYSQDYDLWIRLLKEHEAANLPVYLVKYRVNKESVSFKREKQQEKNLLKIWIKNLKYGNLPPEALIYFSRVLLRYAVPMKAKHFLRRTVFRSRSYRALLLEDDR